MSIGNVVFWYDPDNNVGSGVGKVVDAFDDTLCLEMLSGSYAEVYTHEVTIVQDTDVVGVNKKGFLLYYDIENHKVYSDGTRVDAPGLKLFTEDQRRVDAIRESMDQ